MVLSIQIILVIISLVTASMILMNIRRSQINIEDSFFWLLFSGVLLIFAIFPNLIIMFSKFLGFESPANFVFLTFIFLLIANQYRMSKKISTLEIKLRSLIQHVAISDQENNDK